MISKAMNNLFYLGIIVTIVGVAWLVIALLSPAPVIADSGNWCTTHNIAAPVIDYGKIFIPVIVICIGIAMIACSLIAEDAESTKVGYNYDYCPYCGRKLP